MNGPRFPNTEFESGGGFNGHDEQLTFKNSTTTPWLVHTPKSVKKYKRFRYIYKELKYQSPVDEPKTLSFLDLPPELRIQIYEYSFVIEDPVEFWAETGDVTQDETVRYHQGRAYCRIFKQVHNLRFLRTCKQIRAEVAAVFYGQNDFRFSGVNGHMVAYAWLLKIGPRNWPHIRSMTIGMPFRCSHRSAFSPEENPRSWKLVHELYNKMPFSYPTGKPEWRFKRLKFERSWFTLAGRLSKLPRLQSLTLVLPETYTYAHGACFCDVKHSYAIDPTMLKRFRKILATKPFFEFHIVRMFDGRINSFKLPGDHTFLIKSLKNIAVCRIRDATFANDGNWRLVDGPSCLYQQGCAISKLFAASEAPIDVLPDIERLFLGP